MNAAPPVHRRCWICNQRATHVMTREGSITLYACDDQIRIDRDEAISRGWTVEKMGRRGTDTRKDTMSKSEDTTTPCCQCGKPVTGSAEFCGGTCWDAWHVPRLAIIEAGRLRSITGFALDDIEGSEGDPDGLTVDGMPWRQWLDAVAGE